jgi:hypothetical protein
VQGQTPLGRTLAGCRKALDLIEQAVDDGALSLPERERSWIPLLRDGLESIPADEEAFVAEMEGEIDSEKVLLPEYGL